MVIVHEPIKVAEHLDKYSESRGMSHSAAFYEWVTFGDHLMRELQETKKYIIRNLSSNGRFEFKTAEDQKRYTYLANVDLILSMNKQDPHDTPPDPGEVGRLTPDLKGRFKRQCMKVKTDTWKYWMACAKKEGLSTRDWVIRRIWVSMAVLHTTDELRRTISNAILNQTIQKDMETYTGLQEFVDAVDTIASRVWVPAFDKFQKAQASFLKNLNKDGPLAEIPNRANRKPSKATAKTKRLRRLLMSIIRQINSRFLRWWLGDDHICDLTGEKLGSTRGAETKNGGMTIYSINNLRLLSGLQ